MSLLAGFVVLGLLVIRPLMDSIMPAFKDGMRRGASRLSDAELDPDMHYLGRQGYTSVMVQRGAAFVSDGLISEPDQSSLDSVIVEISSEQDSIRIWYFITNRTERVMDSIRVFGFTDGSVATRSDIQALAEEWPDGEQTVGVWRASALEPNSSDAFVMLGTPESADSIQGVILNMATSPALP